jgi:chromatin licensing and DNA replication factor 1
VYFVSYETLCEFFNCCCAVLSNSVSESHSDLCRRFTYSNLAQLKYIMPEAIVINKILLRDHKTCCMKPDLQVNLLVDAVEDSVMQKEETHDAEGGNMLLGPEKVLQAEACGFLQESS